ncbi:TAXI family TRAP transporter solute-binding subunit (plasmid) [Leisingera sp. M527]|uniref:TAXI family TRAP transporter solute-binding subunit n=1 Tax=unclassified Leisingera TaxID=2614906 RepID=UPI00101284E5|nr:MULTISPECIES: TAXI family TRAP transporter solute-binding subunit [unclassified Leisingera]MBQ4825992.1 TAXI family TRAP transporter solute-binding subunit [Leisingera sp. HS039]MCF6432788.1 TAXI family TRAP transporter solute-binding subunit [Leisingera sp. MMG026]QAX31870.1 TAXI family TRAP transporter solute-binding subunit [Leisingera sp. NJS204]QBR38703.1 TAXI family TRAP transporter solute-binding subunit [Leisingera sp. NJS201]UWQ35481.1 TAXI family TRAP transporter solute-binding su
MGIFKKLTGAALACTMLTGAAAAQDMTFFRIGTGGAGGTYFPIGGIIANAISNPPGSRACDEGGNCGVPGLVAMAQSTNASAHNVNAIQNGQMEAGLSGAATLHFAYHGTGKFEGNAKPDLRVIANLFPEDLHLVLPEGHKLDGLADLKGKRVGIAQAGSGTQIAVELILDDHGVNRDNMDEAELNNAQSAERIADGQLDAYFYAAGTPVAAMIQLDNTKGMELHNWSAEEIKQANTTVPYYIPSTIPAGTYPGVDYDVNTVAVSGMLVTNANMDEELIYGITKAMWSDTARKLLDNGHPKGKAITLETALEGVEGIGVPLHPGAERFYREIGLLK